MTFIHGILFILSAAYCILFLYSAMIPGCISFLFLSAYIAALWEIDGAE